MLTIRMQRGGRSGHAQYRIVVQDRRTHPKSGRVVAYVGSYNPHSKATTLDKEKIETYLSNGAVPSDRVAKLISKEGLKLPDWYKASPVKEKAVRNPEKRRATAPKVPAKEAQKAEAPEIAATEETAEAGKSDVQTAEVTSKEQSEEQSAEEQPAEAADETEEAEAEPGPAEEPTEDKPAQ